MCVTAPLRASAGDRSLSTASNKAMAKPPAAKPVKHRAPAPLRALGGRPFAFNPDLNRQTRKVLSKHYRAKYGVK